MTTSQTSYAERRQLPTSTDSELIHYAEDYFGSGPIPKHLGTEVPYRWTKPLRELTPETSLGFEVITFAKTVLGIELFPWQKWLLVHALELNEDGTYRFSKLIVLVARQNGKTTLLVVLSLWWMYVDSLRFKDRLHPKDFLVLGTAQDLDTAQEAWDRANMYTDPNPENENGSKALQGRTLKPVTANGRTSMRAKNGARYRIKAATRGGGRGKSSARILMDELREQQNFDAWSSVTKTKNAIFNSQLWGLSNAGDGKSVVLRHVRDQLLQALDLWDELGVSENPEAYSDWEEHADPTMALFEWSAPDGCDLDDPAGVAQANPSLGYSITWNTVMSDRKTDPEAVYRTEVLCQWVTAMVLSYIDVEDWDKQADPASEIAPNSEMVLGVDTSADRSMTYVSVAGHRADGHQHVEVIASRAGMTWVPRYIQSVAEKQGIDRVYIQAKGAPASEFIGEIDSIEVCPVGGSDLGASTGKLYDAVKDHTVFHRGQPLTRLGIEGGVTKRLGDQQVYDRHGSAVDISPVISMCYALFGLGQPPVDVRRSAYEVDDSTDGDASVDWWR